MLRIAVLFLVLCASPVLAQPANLAGRYDVQGDKAANKGPYTGQVVVQRRGESYQLAWQVGKTRFVGTGFFRDGKLAVMFQPPQGSSPGIIFAGRCHVKICCHSVSGITERHLTAESA